MWVRVRTRVGARAGGCVAPLYKITGHTLQPPIHQRRAKSIQEGLTQLAPCSARQFQQPQYGRRPAQLPLLPVRAAGQRPRPEPALPASSSPEPACPAHRPEHPGLATLIRQVRTVRRGQNLPAVAISAHPALATNKRQGRTGQNSAAYIPADPPLAAPRSRVNV